MQTEESCISFGRQFCEISDVQLGIQVALLAFEVSDVQEAKVSRVDMVVTNSVPLGKIQHVKTPRPLLTRMSHKGEAAYRVWAQKSIVCESCRSRVATHPGVRRIPPGCRKRGLLKHTYYPVVNYAGLEQIVLITGLRNDVTFGLPAQHRSVWTTRCVCSD